jgi:phytoene synthase
LTQAEHEVAEAARRVGPPSHWGRYFGHHSKSFRFSARLFPAAQRRTIEGVYAYCRFTDDLVDEASVPVDEARRRLDAWRALSARAHAGERTDVPLLDEVMGVTAARDVRFHYVDELLAGVGMDLDPVAFDTADELRVYTYRVASVVGGWITELFGIRSPALLERAFAMGHAMQLTNIVRDVGEDLRNGRLYVPAAALAQAGVTREQLEQAARAGGPVPAGWPVLVESLMADAEGQYQLGFEALPALPVWYARPVAVAARVYEGIHDAVRAQAYDNLARRAHTSRSRKLRLGARALAELWRLRRNSRHSSEWSLHEVSSGDPQQVGIDA